MKKILILLLLSVYAIHAVGQSVSSTDTTKVYKMRGTYYSDRFVGRKTSNGEVFSQNKYTAAHCSFKFGTLLLVTNLRNGKQVIVRVNDRCPRRNVVDMSRKAARQIGVGSTEVQVQVLPERFYSYWESQEDYLEILENGDFLNFIKGKSKYHVVAKHDAKGSKTGDKKNKSELRGNEVVERKNNTMQDVDYQLYDIELCYSDSRNAAKKQVEQLPIYYQDRVEYKPVVGSNKVEVRLVISAKMPKAESVLKDVKGLFPRAKIVKTR